MAEDALSDFIDEIHQDIAEFAERHLEEDERQEFIDALLERHGYEREARWVAPPPPTQGGNGNGRRQQLVKPRKAQGSKKAASPYFRGR